MQSADFGNDFDDWLNEVSAHSLLVQPDDINAEALARASFRSSKSVNSVASRLHGGLAERGT
jgi:hypothetical protein